MRIEMASPKLMTHTANIDHHENILIYYLLTNFLANYTQLEAQVSLWLETLVLLCFFFSVLRTIKHRQSLRVLIELEHKIILKFDCCSNFVYCWGKNTSELVCIHFHAMAKSTLIFEQRERDREKFNAVDVAKGWKNVGKSPETIQMFGKRNNSFQVCFALEKLEQFLVDGAMRHSLSHWMKII